MELTKDSPPEEVREAWADALESGEYPQGRGALTCVTNKGRAHCCWGVLTELGVKAGLMREVGTDDGVDDVVRVMYELVGDSDDYKYGSYPPVRIHDWAGMDRDTMFAYAGVNDEGTSFAQIAAAVRANDTALLRSRNSKDAA